MIRFRPLAVPTLIMVPCVVLMAGLSLWQFERLQWKENLIAAIHARTQADPVPLNDALANGIEDSEWRSVTMLGHFLHEKEVYLYAPRRGANGVHVLTPFVQANGETILVDRGFVPDAAKDPASRATGQVMGEISVTGTLRATQKPGWFTPSPDPRALLWFSRDVESIAASRGFTARPFFVESGPAPNPGGLPEGLVSRPQLSNNHLGYALTWAALALAMLSIYFLYHFRRGRLTSEA